METSFPYSASTALAKLLGPKAKEKEVGTLSFQYNEIERSTLEISMRVECALVPRDQSLTVALTSLKEISQEGGDCGRRKILYRLKILKRQTFHGFHATQH